MTEQPAYATGDGTRKHNQNHREQEVQFSKTRVCIKNISPKTTERDLKEYFLSQGTRNNDGVKLQITDCKILKNEKGKSRKVAFVGFRSADQAQYVIRTFHRAFLNMTRISVEPAIARKYANENDALLNGINNSKENYTISKGLGEKKVENRNNETKETDEKVKELLSLMGATTKKTKFWSNDDDIRIEAGPENVEFDVLQELGGDQANTDEDNNSSSSDSSNEEMRSVDANDENEPHNQFKNEIENDTKHRNYISDLDFLWSKQKQVDDLDNIEDERSHQDGKKQAQGERNPPHQATTRTDKAFETSVKAGESSPSADVGDGQSADDFPRLAESRLFVRNLPFETTEEELEEYFSSFGQLVECHIPVDDERRNKGYAFVTFKSALDAQQAKRVLDKVDFQGRLLHILDARPPPENATNVDSSSLSWKQKQELSRKEVEAKAAGKASEGWSASFVRGDAVVDNLAERLGLRKGDVLSLKDGLSSGDAAVRLALGETQIIEENREFFRERGVDMDVLVSTNASKEDEKLVKRSKNAILVKNLPFDTRVEELMKLFHMGVAPVKILLPPSRTIALVEFQHSTDAKKAFRKLAYRRFKHVPIYLEWAPLEARYESHAGVQIAPGDKAVDKDSKQTTTLDVDDENRDVMNETVSTTIYVKNLNFATTEETLRNVFEKELKTNVISSRIPRKVAPTKTGATAESRCLSMGYGFVELTSQETAQTAIRLLQGKLVDGHALHLAVSSQNSTTGPISFKLITKNKKLPSKIMVRNVPFQATRQELLKLFGTFGQLRKVRLPKKFDGGHRGFAFVEYLTGKEALAAMAALSRTHLYGRHLVLEWASDDGEDLVNLRDKAKRDAIGSPSQPQKKIRFK